MNAGDERSAKAVARAVVDFARFLQQQAGDREWERILDDPRPRSKLDAFVAQALREEPSGLIL